MQRLSHCLLCVCLSWNLLMLLLSHAATQDLEDDMMYEYEGTSLPDYDSNSTFDFTFFSNVSNFYEDLQKYWTESTTREPIEHVEKGEEDVSQGTDSGAPIPWYGAARAAEMFIATGGGNNLGLQGGTQMNGPQRHRDAPLPGISRRVTRASH
ncbi:hypothetical protein GN956_G16504 [Arapaima gigas]